MAARPASLALALLLLGCRAPAAQPEPAQPRAAAADTVVPDAPLWSRDGVAAQPRIEWFGRRVPPEMGYEPGTTAWRPAERVLPAELSEAEAARHGSPGEALVTLIRSFGGDAALGNEAWEQTLRVWQEDDERAVGAVLVWGLQDDSVIGHDLLAHLRRGTQGWYVERLEERFHCARRVTPEGLCA